MEPIRYFISLFRFPFRFEKKTSRIEFDPSVFKECTSKVERAWSWKELKHRKFLVHFKDGKFIIKELR